MNGTEFTTEFTLKAKENGGWYDPDADDTLMYEAGSVDAVGKEVPFGERQSSKEFTKILLKKGIILLIMYMQPHGRLKYLPFSLILSIVDIQSTLPVVHRLRVFQQTNNRVCYRSLNVFTNVLVYQTIICFTYHFRLPSFKRNAKKHKKTQFTVM